MSSIAACHHLLSYFIYKIKSFIRCREITDFSTLSIISIESVDSICRDSTDTPISLNKVTAQNS